MVALLGYADWEEENEDSDESEAGSHSEQLGGQSVSIVKQKDLLEGCCQDLSSILDSLLHVSLHIRGLENNLRLTKAAEHVELKDGVDVLGEFRNLVIRSLRSEKVPPEWLVQRLAEATTLRRRQFYYQRALQALPFADSNAKFNKDAFDLVQPHLSTASTTAMTTTARRLVTEHMPKQQSVQTLEIKSARSGKRLDENSFPEPPQEPEGKEFQCAHCFRTLLAETRDPTLWRYHGLRAC